MPSQETQDGMQIVQINTRQACSVGPRAPLTSALFTVFTVPNLACLMQHPKIRPLPVVVTFAHSIIDLRVLGMIANKLPCSIAGLHRYYNLIYLSENSFQFCDFWKRIVFIWYDRYHESD